MNRPIVNPQEIIDAWSVPPDRARLVHASLAETHVPLGVFYGRRSVHGPDAELAARVIVANVVERGANSVVAPFCICDDTEEIAVCGVAFYGPRPETGVE